MGASWLMKAMVVNWRDLPCSMRQYLPCMERNVWMFLMPAGLIFSLIHQWMVLAGDNGSGRLAPSLDGTRPPTSPLEFMEACWTFPCLSLGVRMPLAETSLMKSLR